MFFRILTGKVRARIPEPVCAILRHSHRVRAFASESRHDTGRYGADTDAATTAGAQLAVSCLRIAVALFRWWLGLAFGSSPYEQDRADYDQQDPVKDVRPEGSLVGPEVSAAVPVQ